MAGDRARARRSDLRAHGVRQDARRLSHRHRQPGAARAWGPLPDRTEIVYVSPLKALSNDVHKNLEVPLAEISALARERGVALAPIRAALRTGDTPQADRQRMTRNRPHILVTTPESLFILLTAAEAARDAGRRAHSDRGRNPRHRRR
jgi:Lhr-like helicase